ncbi:hypothetical protein [Microcella pacifica]|uniref:Uncharacterized protein n=1 Tax=Microcella pacifica TaxID=2591847 RepID=A0A9E5MI70_9MICO|nr:hypothetical protein [Microcella pacifica]NHF62388.1 hypothetical protein [Microcella pacifica]
MSDDQLDDDVLDADDIIELLYDFALLESIGTPLEEDGDDGIVRRAGRTHCHSQWSGDDIPAYELHVTTWTDPNHDAVVDHFDDDFRDWSRLLFVVAGDGWSVAGLAGQLDSIIPHDIVERVVDCVGGRVVTQREIPEPWWFTARFRTTQQILEEFDRLGISHAPIEGDDLERMLDIDPYLRECIPDDTYRPITITREPSSLGTATLHLLIEDRLAEMASDFAASYLCLPSDGEWAICAGDGWTATLTADGNVRYPLVLWAAELMGAMGGSLVAHSPTADPLFSNPVTIDAFSALGVMVRLPYDTVEKLNESYEADDFTPPKTLITLSARLQSDLSFFAREALRTWAAAYLASRMLTNPGPQLSEREFVVVGMARRTCWAALSLALLGIDRAKLGRPHLVDSTLREVMLNDVRMWEDIAGSMTEARGLRSGVPHSGVTHGGRARRY